MNIQIFGINKSFDTKKAQRFFKERGIKFQYIDLDEKEMARGEFDSISRVIPLLELFDKNNKDKTNVQLMEYLSEEAKKEKLFECQHLMRLPIVRNGRKATAGYKPDVWKKWQEEDK